MDEETEDPYFSRTTEVDKVYLKWFGGQNHSDRDLKIYARYIHAQCMFAIDNFVDIWDADEAKKSIEEFVSLIEKIYELYARLPISMKKELETQYENNFMYFHYDDIFPNGKNLSLLLLVLKDSVKGVRDLEEKLEDMGGPKANRNIDVVAKVLEKNYPVKRYRNTDPIRWRAILVVDIARKNWEILTDKKAPKYLNRKNPKFAQFLNELLSALNIGRTADSAMNAWHEEKSTLKL